MRWVHACPKRGDEGIRKMRIDKIIDCPYAALDLRRFRREDFWGGGYRFGTGIRLHALSIENGKTRRNATSPHNVHVIHSGALRKASRKIRTASTSQLAAMLKFAIFKTKASITIPLTSR